jgi:hypothetical protein
MDIVPNGHSDKRGEPITLSPSHDLYVVEFERCPNDLGVSVIVPANCGIAAKLRAWAIFPEYLHSAKCTSAHKMEYAEIDWQSGRSVIVKMGKRPEIPEYIIEPVARLRRRTSGEGDTE